MKDLPIGTQKTHDNLIALGSFHLPLLSPTNTCVLMVCADGCRRYPFFGSICCVWVGDDSWRAEFHRQQVGSDSNLQVHKARQ